MKSPSYLEIATSFPLWQEYSNPSGYDTESEFNAKSTEEKIAFLVSYFGEESEA